MIEMNIMEQIGRRTKKKEIKREINKTLETNKKREKMKRKYIDSCDLDVASA